MGGGARGTLRSDNGVWLRDLEEMRTQLQGVTHYHDLYLV